MASIYRIPNREAAETHAIRQLIRTSNAENIARRRAQDEMKPQEKQITRCRRDLRVVQ